jgi:hypothetical protein
MEQVRPGLSALASICCVLAMAACSGKEKALPLPSGFQPYRTDAYSFGYPAGWTVTPQKDPQGRPGVSIDGPVVPPGVYQGQVQVGRWDHFHQRFDDQLSGYRAMSTVGAREMRVDRAVKIARAAEAHRFEAIYSTRTAGGTPVRLQVTDLYVLTKNKVLLDFTVRSPEGAAVAARLPEILASLRMLES